MERNERYISVDSGKYKTKYAVLKGNKIVTGSFLTRMDEVSELEEPEQNTYIVGYEGKWYRIGDNATTPASKDTTKKSDCHRLAAWVAVALNCNSGDTINMAIGCPISVYEEPKQRTAYKEYMLPEGKIRIKIRTKTGLQTKEFSFGKRAVFPEGSGVVYLDFQKYSKKLIAICDIGGLNMNAALYDKNILQHKYNVTKNLGGRVLIDELTDALNAEYNTDIPVKLIESKMFDEDKSSRFIISGDDPVKSKQESPQFIKEFITSYLKQIYQACKEKGIDPLNIDMYFIGGTSGLLKDEIAEVFPLAHIIEDPEYVNAKGWAYTLCSLCKIPFQK